MAMETWRQPLLFGVGEGGTLAYLALAQAPNNMAAGAISLGFDAHFESKLLLCAGAPKVAVHGTIYAYAPAKELPGRWTWIANETPQGDLAKFATSSSEATVKIVGGARTLQRASEALSRLRPRPESLAGMPCRVAGRDKPSAWGAISGDGGWTPLTSRSEITLPAWVAVKASFARYFWSKKTIGKSRPIRPIVAHYQANGMG